MRVLTSTYVTAPVIGPAGRGSRVAQTAVAPADYRSDGATVSALPEYEQVAGEDRIRVLAADDDPDILALLAIVLRKGGYEVVTAPDGAEALRLARETAPDLVLLDVSMPGLSGYEVCAELQRGDMPPPVIFLTAHGHTSARVQGLDAGAVDYVAKPFDGAELTARVRAALRTKTVRDTLATEASVDALTGLLNRSQLHARAAELVAVAQRHGRSLSCLLADLDHFKRINDTYGHAAGDTVLQQAALRVKTEVRISDVAVRYGGEEFLLLLPETDLEGAVTMGERLRQGISGCAIEVIDGLGSGGTVAVTVTASLGAAEWHPEMRGAAELISAADGALYRAKQSGRNRLERAA
jgi:diguanylate cyclase (GGDEF)-like protein